MMKKFKVFFRFDKEERWLERMAAGGWLLCRKSILYHFKRVNPEEKTIRIDFREMKSAKDFMDYRMLFEDSGWRHIAGTSTSGTQYFLKTGENCPDDIFSDERSKAGRYKRVSRMWLSLAVTFLPLVVVMIDSEWGAWRDALFTPREWYLTPGLWELNGFSFWFSFLFETPFALMRGIGWLMPIIALLLYVGCAAKSWYLYRTALASGR